MKPIFLNLNLHLILLVYAFLVLEAQEHCKDPPSAEEILEKVKSLKNKINENIALAYTIANSPPPTFEILSYLVENDEGVSKIKENSELAEKKCNFSEKVNVVSSELKNKAINGICYNAAFILKDTKKLLEGFDTVPKGDLESKHNKALLRAICKMVFQTDYLKNISVALIFSAVAGDLPVLIQDKIINPVNECLQKSI